MFSFATNLSFFFNFLAERLLVQQKWAWFTLAGVEACLEQFRDTEGLEKMRISRSLLLCISWITGPYVHSYMQVVMHSGQTFGL